MIPPSDEHDFDRDGGLDTLIDLRRATAGDSSVSGVPAIILDPNKFRLSRLLRGDHRIYGIPTPFVGRREELEAAYNAVRDALNTSRLHTISVVGPSGVGKTRLLSEMFTLTDPVRRGIEVQAACCSDSESPDGIAVISQLVRRRFGIGPLDSDTEAREKIQEGIRPLVDQRLLRTAGRQLAYLAGVRSPAPGQPPPARAVDFLRLAVATLANLLRYQSERSPQILVVYRAQHMTPRTLTIFENVLDALADTPTVLIFVGDRPLPPSLATASARHTALTLEPLGARDMERLVRVMLQKVEDVPAGLVDDLIARSAGNPRLVEDNVRLLVQRGGLVPGEDRWALRPEALGGRIDLAATTEAAARARVASLSPELRQVLGIASVFGPAFWRDGVLALLRVRPVTGRAGLVPWVKDATAEALDALLARAVAEHLIAPQAQPALLGQQEYAFRYRDDRLLLYDALEPGRAAELHRLAGQWFVGLRLPDPAPWYEVIGEHFEAGGRPERAAEQLLHAAEAAREGYGAERAMTFFHRALALVDTDRMDLLVPILRGLGELSMATGDLVQGRRIFSALLEASLVTSDRATGALAWLMLGQSHRRLGDLNRARPCFRHAEQLYRELGDPAGIAAVLDQTAKVVWTIGHSGAFDDALRYFEQALALRRRIGVPAAIAQSLTGLAAAQLHCGQTAAAERGFREALALHRDLGDRPGEAKALSGLGRVLHASGRREEGLDAWHEALDIAEASGDRDVLVDLLLQLGESALAASEEALAARCLEEALKTASEMGDRRAAAEIHTARGALAIARADVSGALEEVDAAITIAQELGMRPALGRALRTRADVLGHQLFVDESGDDVLGQKACQCFEGALGIFEEIGDQLEVDRTLASYLRFLSERGDEEAARDVRERATESARRRHLSLP
ncbi:MAG: AAA family ATPase [Deltaproteobacteria bacterium]|nr:AAA family ATPase [Deltaproteobacteria bacterium]